jgi:hypothetical protein
VTEKSMVTFECKPLTPATLTCTFFDDGFVGDPGYQIVMIDLGIERVGVVRGTCQSLETIAVLRRAGSGWLYTQTRRIGLAYDSDTTCKSPKNTWTTVPVTWRAKSK